MTSPGIPPKHIVVVMLENRSFDSALGYLYTPSDPPRVHVPPLGPDEEPFHGLPSPAPKLTAKLSDGTQITQAPVPAVRADNTPGTDPGEEFAHVNRQLFGSPDDPSPGTEPGMLGFLQDYADVVGADASQAETVKQILHMYTPADLPVLSTLARCYAVSDLWFASVPTQTNANRAFSICGTSVGLVDNGFLTEEAVSYLLDDDRFKARTIWNVLADAQVDSWTVFWSEAYPPVISSEPYTRRDFPYVEEINGIDSHYVSTDEFFKQARAGSLPRFSYVEVSWGGAILEDLSKLGTDYHPPSDTTSGELWIRSIYEALTHNSDAWNQTLLVVLFDEHGGCYDHVPPPAAVPPWGVGNKPPFKLQYDFGFDRYGVRVPAILVSPWIAPGTVFRSSTGVPYDHTSVIATILKLLDVPSSQWELGERVAQAPTFEGVLTLTQPRTDNAFSPRPAAAVGTPISFGDPFYLRCSDGKQVVAAYAGDRYYFPQLGSGPPVVLRFRNGHGQVPSGATVQIRTDEDLRPELDTELGVLAGIRNFLGAWRDSTDCYYFSSDDAENYQEQYWTVTKADGSRGRLLYGDPVTIVSNYYPGQGLVPNGQYLTTESGPELLWTLMPAPNVYGSCAATADEEDEDGRPGFLRLLWKWLAMLKRWLGLA